MDTIELKSSLKDLEIRLIEIRDGVFNLIAKAVSYTHLTLPTT